MTGFVRQSLPALVRSALPDAVYEGELPDVRVTGVTYDSRQLQAGFVFVAFQGYSVDGHRYIPQAIERGAIAVVGTEDLQQPGSALHPGGRFTGGIGGAVGGFL